MNPNRYYIQFAIEVEQLELNIKKLYPDYNFDIAKEYYRESPASYLHHLRFEYSLIAEGAYERK